MQRIVVLTSGLWKLRREIATLTGMEVAQWRPFLQPSFDAVAGWGHARTAKRAAAWPPGQASLTSLSKMACCAR
jgi:hypothetical protein